MTRHLLALPILLLIGLPLLGRQPAQGQRTADEERDLVFFADARPVLVRLHLRVNSEPFLVAQQKAREQFHRSLFRYLDRDGKGWLNEAEARRLPPPPTWRRHGQRDFGPANIAFNFQVLDADGDGRVSLQEVTDYYRIFSIDHLAMEQVTRRAPIRTAAVDDALFQRADRNKDGRLSRDELKAFAATILAVDQDSDELIGPEEILADAVVAENAPAQRPASAFLLLAPGDDRAPLVRTLLARYRANGDRPADNKLSRKAIGLDAATFDRLDIDKDGWLDEPELARFTERPADVELVVHLGERQSEQKVVEIIHVQETDAAEWRVRQTDDGAVVLDVNNVRLEIQGLRDSLRLVIDENRQAFRRRFQSLRRGGKAWLAKDDAASDRLFAGLFERMDRDGNGKLDSQEAEAYLEAVLVPQMRAELSRPEILVSEEGRGLFDLLDRNRDGVLSRLELQAAAKTLAFYMRDPAGLRREDIPRCYQIILGPSSYEPAATVEVETPGLPLSGWRTAPLWFRKMDRNRDGCVSPSEFLGTREQFRLLDKNGDGLISIEEAEQAERKEK